MVRRKLWVRRKLYLSINGDTEFTGSRLETMLSEIRTNFESSSEFHDVDRIPVLVRICFAMDFKSQDCRRKLRWIILCASTTIVRYAISINV